MSQVLDQDLVVVLAATDIVISVVQLFGACCKKKIHTTVACAIVFFSFPMFHFYFLHHSQTQFFLSTHSCAVHSHTRSHDSSVFEFFLGKGGGCEIASVCGETLSVKREGGEAF